jgi:hypothetical protein
MAEHSRPVTGTTKDHDANAVYALGSSRGESARLQRQADELAADSAALLADPGVRAALSPAGRALPGDRGEPVPGR